MKYRTPRPFKVVTSLGIRPALQVHDKVFIVFQGVLRDVASVNYTAIEPIGAVPACRKSMSMFWFVLLLNSNESTTISTTYNDHCYFG
jgi:hypothetical protein